ncbi:hypothetical protein BGZ65_005052 [Modicella reniformis]|uniref:F-box domain-containing protein n=1 Tax=Modicella reniformis TaxID=1440133 RepID=A0A9P6IKD5_9FUNG|nr:hypothetical protein BGZ65_005052 [Modicella reniformis]
MASPSDLSALGLILERVIEASVAKAVAKAMAHTSGSVTMTPKSSNGSFTLLQYVGIEKRVPFEVWVRILQYLYPSQLSRVSMVCRTLYEIVSELAIWPEIYTKAHPDNKNHLIGGIKPTPGKNPRKLFMHYLCAEGLQICELCYSVYSGSDVSKDRLAFFPLPIHVWRVRAFLMTVQFLPFSPKRPTDWTIRLCLVCRKAVFAHCPESVPKGAVGSVFVVSKLAAKYNLTGLEIRPGYNSFQDVAIYEEPVLVLARLRYGGDIGIAAAAPGSSTAAIISMESRLEEICRGLTITSMDG